MLEAESTWCFMCVCFYMYVRVCRFVRAHVEQQLSAGVSVCFWPCVCCQFAVCQHSQGNAWLPIQAGVDPAVPS